MEKQRKTECMDTLFTFFRTHGYSSNLFNRIFNQIIPCVKTVKRAHLKQKSKKTTTQEHGACVEVIFHLKEN